MKLILTCEHAGNEIPSKFQFLFNGHEAILNSHQGYDLGAYNLFQYLLSLADFNSFQRISRLLVEMNRSEDHPQLFSKFSNVLPLKEKHELLETYYFPYRDKVQQKIGEFIKNGEKVFHLSVHSFTPVLNGKTRTTDMGFLYDPNRISEKALSKKMKTQLKKDFPNLKIRMNYPYLGTADGFTTVLRKKFPKDYMGIELEINQKFSVKNEMGVSFKSRIYIMVDTIMRDAILLGFQ